MGASGVVVDGVAPGVRAAGGCRREDEAGHILGECRGESGRGELPLCQGGRAALVTAGDGVVHGVVEEGREHDGGRDRGGRSAGGRAAGGRGDVVGELVEGEEDVLEVDEVVVAAVGFGPAAQQVLAEGVPCGGIRGADAGARRRPLGAQEVLALVSGREVAVHRAHPQAGGAQPHEQDAGRDRLRPGGDRGGVKVSGDVVVVEVEAAPGDAEAAGEHVQFGVARVRDEVAPHRAVRRPQRRIDEDGHGRGYRG